MDVSKTIESDWKEVVNNFDEMNLKKELLRGIYAYGFEKPTAIQQRAIFPCIKGHHVIAQAQCGTGKTATFSISILQRIDTSLNECQALILAPTRELAKQIQKMFIALGYFMKVDCHACIGGTKIRDDMHKLDTGSHVVVGTPGRVYDMIARKSLQTKFIKIFVLDEVNEMLSRGFERKDLVKEVFKFLKEDIQVIKFSTTMSEDVLDVSTHFMRRQSSTNSRSKRRTDIGRFFYINVTKEEWKFDTLSISQAVIFCNTHRKVKWLAENMRLKKFSVSAIHKGMS
ncbi:eukaryotic initiation factor 4A-like [Aphis craccivora]|uniref:RNA helicase n=1 Tax=Aphis craccivora TaxID=307492 RepID=A0A6G0W9W9_APHCR|nr:eukaryotic initiation factor 4A-like [Aphis craccivora]